MWWITTFSKELHESPSTPPPACSMHVQKGRPKLHIGKPPVRMNICYVQFGTSLLHIRVDKEYPLGVYNSQKRIGDAHGEGML